MWMCHELGTMEEMTVKLQVGILGQIKEEVEWSRKKEGWLLCPIVTIKPQIPICLPY